MTGNEIATRDTDSWAAMVPAVGHLAEKIAETEFVPVALRNKPAAVAACILAGRELGLGPMLALQQIHVVEGRPAPSAELQRALVLAQGHALRFTENTTTRCIVSGRRRGEDVWTDVTWTMDDARRAGLDQKNVWRKYPRRMLAARATAELCRLLFADVVGGMPFTIEELTDDAGDDTDVTTPVEQAPARRTARRRVEPAEAERATTAPHAVAVSRAEHAAAERDEVPAPALTPPEPGPPAEPAEPEQAEPDRRPVTRSQLTKLHATFNDVGIDDRGERLSIASSVLRRDLTSSSELTRAEAGALIDVLDTCLRQESPLGALYDLLAATDAPAEEGDAS